MANSKSIVELILQTKVEGEQTLDQLRNTVVGLIKDQESAEKQAGDYDQQIEKLRATMDSLSRAERDLVQKGRLVEKYKAQDAATSKSAASSQKLIQTIRELRAEIKQLDEGTTERSKLEAQLKKTSAASERATAQATKQKAKLAELSAEMKAAGLSAGKLATAETRLAADASRIQSAQNQTADAIGRVQIKSEQAARAVKRFGTDSRTSLSLIQRLRGEVLSLAAAYVGLFGIGREVGNVFQAVRQKEAIESRFRVAFDGDPTAVKEELEFLRKTSDRLKVSFLDLGTEYSQMVAALPDGLFTLNEVRKLFVDVTTAGRVMRLSQEQIRGTFKAFRDIVSKSTVQMEELKGQLGDRLPGAVLLFAESMKVSTRELVKMVEQGEVGARELLPFANLLAEKYGGDLEKALKAATTQLDAFLIEVERVRIEVGEDSGFIEVLGESLKTLSEELRKPEFKEGIIGLAQLMGELAKAGVFLVQNLDAVKNTLVVLLSAKVLGGLVRSFFSARAAVAGLIASLRTLGIIGIAISGPAGWIFALAAGILTVALNSRKSGPDVDSLIAKYTALGESAQKAGEKLEKALGSGGPKLAVDEEINGVITDLNNLVLELQRLEDFKGRNSFFASLVGTDKEINKVNAALDLGRRHLTNLRQQREKLLGQDKKGEVAPLNLGLNEKQLEDLDKAIEKANKAINKFEAVTLQQKLAQVDKAFAELLKTARSADDPANRAAQEKKVLEAVALQKREIVLGEEKKLLAEFERIETAAAKQSADTLQGRLDNIRGKYEDFIKTARELGRNVEADRVESILADELSGEIEQVKAKLRETLTKIRAEDGNDLDARLQLIREKYTKLIADLNQLSAEGVDVGDGITLAGNTQKAELDAARLAHAEEEINRLMEVREARLARINLQREAGVLTTFDAQEQMRTAVEELDPQLQALLDKAVAMAEAMGNEQMVENLRAMKAELQVTANNLNPILQKLGEIRDSFAQGLSKAIVDFGSGAKGAKDAFRDFARDFLIQIAQMILQQQILLALQAATGTVGQGGPASGGASGGVGGFLAGLFHGGGIVGQGGGSSRYDSPLAYAGAYRYHTGGLAGIKPDETRAILQKGEEVLTQDDPRHRNNGGGSSTKVLQPMIFQDIDDLRRALLSTPKGVETLVTIQSENPEKFNIKI